MATKLKPVEVVTVGVGLTGTILAKELADSGLKVVGLERGGWRDTHPDFDMPHAHDELRYARRHELMQDLSRETLTFRNAIGDAAKQLGYPPFPAPSANLTRPYTTPDGVTLGACVYCGYCERFGCEMGAKASPQTTVLPVLMKNPNYELRTLANVIKVNLDFDRKRATGVTYVDSRGREFE